MISHRTKTISLFVGVFFVTLGILNIRFLGVSLKYYVNKASFLNAHPSARLLPIAKAVTENPLPDEARLVIDNINVSAPIVFGRGSNEDVIYDNLEDGVVHYDSSVKPGLKGVAIILGHSSAFPWYKGDYGAVFALLNKLQPGDKVLVQYSDGRTFTFVVQKSIIFNPLGDEDRLKEFEQTSKRSIVLLSCWPVGTNYRRIAVQAEVL